MEVAFKNVVERIFSNWTALKLAVDHNMGGPNSRQVFLTQKEVFFTFTKQFTIFIYRQSLKS